MIAMMFHWIDLFLFLIAVLAGTVDTLAGGGGLITVPSLIFSGMDVVTAFGTNKLQSAVGEFSAGIRFWKGGRLKFKGLGYGLIFTIIGSILGTLLLQSVPVAIVNMLAPWLLLFVLLYYLISPKPRKEVEKGALPNKPRLLPWIGVGVGFYNGFFGPGTGVIWVVLLMRFYELRINVATIYAKPLNFVGNLTALSLFVSAGNVHYLQALIMGIGSIIGGQIGASLVMYRSSSLLRTVFLSIMIIMVGYSFIRFYVL